MSSISVKRGDIMPPNPLYSDMGSGVFCVHAFDESFCQPYMHAHMQYEFLFVIQGSILVENSKQTVTSKPPCVIIHCPYTLHRAQTTDQHSGIYERYVINFKENLLSDFSEYIDLSRLKSFGMTQIPLAEQTSKFLKACCEQIIEANSNSNRKEHFDTCRHSRHARKMHGPKRVGALGI